MGGAGLERAMNLLEANRSELGLTDEQMAQLEALAADLDVATEGVRRDQAALTAEIQSGAVSPEDARERRRQLAEEGRAAVEPFHERFEAILTEDQHEELRSLMRASMRGGRGGGMAFRSGRGPARGPGGAWGQARYRRGPGSGCDCPCFPQGAAADTTATG